MSLVSTAEQTITCVTVCTEATHDITIDLHTTLLSLRW